MSSRQTSYMSQAHLDDLVWFDWLAGGKKNTEARKVNKRTGIGSIRNPSIGGRGGRYLYSVILVENLGRGESNEL